MNENENDDDDDAVVLTEPSMLPVAVAADRAMVLRRVLMIPLQLRLGNISR